MLTQTEKNQRFRAKYPEYIVWQDMMRRCHRRKNHNYERYGGRGITVCARWRRGWRNFFDDMGPRPTPHHTLERVDNFGPYDPNNCIWATRKKNQRNMRSNRLLTYRGRTQCVTEWAEELGLTRTCIFNRLWRGDSDMRALRL